MIEFRLIESTNIYSVIPLLKVLDDSIALNILKQRLTKMMAQGYQCVGIYDGKKLIGACGMWFLTKYYVGDHVEPDNVILLPAHRHQGIGKQLMEWIYNYAKSKGCVASELNCYISNEPGRKFWEGEGYQAIGLHYQKKLWS